MFDAKGRRLGRIHHLMIDKYSGQVVYAVASFGGFFETRATAGYRYRGGRLSTNRVLLAMSSMPTVTNWSRRRAATASEPDWPDRAFDQEIEQYWYPPL